MTGFEPVTSSLPRTRSTAELHRLLLSGRRDSNPRPSAWKADALGQLSYSRGNQVGGAGFEPTKANASRFTVCPS